MTEKRLIVRDGDYAWIDTVTDTAIEVEDAFDLVNELHEENKELKKQREELFIRERDTKNKLRKLRKENYDLVKLINDLGNEEMDRQMEEILND